MARRRARAAQEEDAPEAQTAPVPAQEETPKLPIGSLEEKQAAVERAFSLGVLSQEERTAEHKRLLGMGPRTPPSHPRELLVSETGERKREFLAERERLVGTFGQPKPSPELITFIRSFPTSVAALTLAHTRAVFDEAVRIWPHLYEYVCATYPLPPPTAEASHPALLQDYRLFLGTMGACKYFAEGHPSSSRRHGGLAKALSCDTSFFKEDLSFHLKHEGDDIVSRFVALQEKLYDKRPRMETPKGKFFTRTPCNFCKSIGRHEAATTHTEDICINKTRLGTKMSEKQTPDNSYTTT